MDAVLMSRRRVSRRGHSSASSLPTAKELSELDKLRQSEVVMKARIRTLEVEVDTLKSRLDGLRKAKNTTIIRREREEIRVSSPKLGRHRSSTTSIPTPHPPPTPTPNGCRDNRASLVVELKSQIDKLNAELLSERAGHEKHVQELRERHAGEMNTARKGFQEEVAKLQREMDQLKEGSVKDSLKCQEQHDVLLAELERLRKENAELTEKLEELLSANQQLRDSHLLLQGKCETLLEDLSVKEARWTHREEQLKAEIRKKWGERYQEWITKAEKKMEELQQVNALLQSMMKTRQHNPDV